MLYTTPGEFCAAPDWVATSRERAHHADSECLGRGVSGEQIRKIGGLVERSVASTADRARWETGGRPCETYWCRAYNDVLN